jgi:hypothetical protein
MERNHACPPPGGRPQVGPWTGFGTGVYNFGGPALHTSAKGGILLAARDVPEKRSIGFPTVCKVWTVTPTRLESPFVVPSGGDCAYQSFADLNGETFQSYAKKSCFSSARGVLRWLSPCSDRNRQSHSWQTSISRGV